MTSKAYSSKEKYTLLKKICFIICIYFRSVLLKLIVFHHFIKKKKKYSIIFQSTKLPNILQKGVTDAETNMS